MAARAVFGLQAGLTGYSPLMTETEREEYPAGTEVPDEAEDDATEKLDEDQPGLADEPPAAS